MKLTDIQQTCLRNNLPFFAFRMPLESDVVMGVQLTPEVAAFEGFAPGRRGFVAVPFDDGSCASALWIEADILTQNGALTDADAARVNSCRFAAKERRCAGESIGRDEYLQQANDLIDRLRKGELEKVVLSRTIVRATEEIPDVSGLFEQMCDRYPNACVSMFYVPGECMWLGATPETLLTVEGERVSTMSLAGTKVQDAAVKWSAKEREEQEMVSLYVEDVLAGFEFRKVTKEGPTEHRAGHLCHLMTRYDCEGKLTREAMTRLVELLHPTPAVCGLPKESSLQLIRQTEKHDREYYAGYLGFVSDERMHLYVNLRCMKIEQGGITCYVGGGLTALSDAEAEWNETCLKAETLLGILENK